MSRIMRLVTIMFGVTVIRPVRDLPSMQPFRLVRAATSAMFTYLHVGHAVHDFV